MKGLAITEKGLEGIAAKEIEEKTGSKGKTDTTTIIFDVKKEKDLCKLAYTAQSVSRILLLVSEFKVSKELEETVENLKKKTDLSSVKKWSELKTRVKCEREGKHDFNSVDLAGEAGRWLGSKDYNVSLKNEELKLYIYVYEDRGYFCVDFSGRDLSKRNYRIFTKAGTLKGTLGYTLVRLADYEPGEKVLNANGGMGVIAIEAALMAIKKPVNYYQKEFAFQKLDKSYEEVFEEEDKKIEEDVEGICCYDRLLRNVSGAKKNAKIAGVDKAVNFSKIEIEWLDTKFDEDELDKLITKLPSPSNRMPKKHMQKLYEEFFYQTEFIVKDDGLVMICSLKNDVLKEVADKKGYEVTDEKSIYSGQEEYKVTFLKKVYKEDNQ